jgi:hypothetical protein
MTMLNRQRTAGVTGERRGMALMLAIVMIVVITLLVIGGFFTSTREFQGGRNALVEQRSFAVAEYGLNAEVSAWNTGRNLTPGAGGMAIGARDSLTRYVADGDTAFVSVTRITDNTFWVISDGRASMGTLSQESRRRTNAMVRLAYPTINPDGAITSAGHVELTGNSYVSGQDTPPPGWSCPPPGPPVAAMHVPPHVEPDYKTKNVDPMSAAPVKKSDVAGDPETYVQYGSETWNSLVANADIILPNGNHKNGIAPIGNATSCTPGQYNWGEPFRDASSVAGCYGHFPIIYADGDLELQSNGRGQGILIVNGSLALRGNFDFYGIVIVRDNVDKGNGTATIHGAVFARDAKFEENIWSGNQNVSYSKCAIENALRGSAILTRVKERHWSMLY